MTDHTPTPAAPDPAAPDFTPVTVRHRHDGWTPARQITFINALAETACIEEAAQRVGMSRESAYVLRRRPEAVSFRRAWDIALDHAISRLGDAALGRAMNGVATPIFYKGQQIGERRRYDEKLTMFLLRYRDPVRYGTWRDDMAVQRGDPDGATQLLGRALERVALDAAAVHAGRTPPARLPLATEYRADDPEIVALVEEQKEKADQARRERAWETMVAALAEEEAAHRPPQHRPPPRADARAPHVASTL